MPGSILVTGGTGFLGGSVVRELAKLGEEIILLVRDGREVADPPPGVRIVRGDITDMDDVGGAMLGCSTVVHMAAMVSIWHPRPELFRAVNVEGLRNILRAASFSAVDRILYTSTILALGPTDGVVGDESRPAATPFPQNLYMATKAEALTLAREQMSMGSPLTILYPGIIYGPGPAREAGIMTKLLGDLIAGKLPGIVGPGDQPWSHALTDDVAAGHRLALERGRTGQEYILGGPNATLTEWLSTACEVTGARLPRLRIPYGLAKLIGLVEIGRARLTGRTPELVPNAVDVFRHAWAFSSARAEAELGYRQTPLAEGLRRTAASLRQGGVA